jgi:arsenate reductase
MAEGLARHFRAELGNFYSAGIEKHGMNVRAVRVMNEINIEMSSHYSKTLADLKDIQFDLVITVCGHASESCPVFFGAPRVVHVGFDDPPTLTKNMTNEEEILIEYRRVRDEIKKFVLEWKL